MITHFNRHTAFSSCSGGDRAQGVRTARPSLAEGLFFCHNAEVGADCSGIIATGADASSRIGLGHASGVALSYNHGCLNDTRCRVRYDDALRLLSRHFPPEVIATESHHALASSHAARYLARRTGARLVAIGHHHAHAVSVMAENGLDGEVAAIVLDSGKTADDADERRRRGSQLLVCSRAHCSVAAHADYVAVPRDARSWEAAVGLILHYTGSLRWIPAGLVAAVGRSNILDAARRCCVPAESVLVSGGEALWDAVAALIGTEQGAGEGAIADATWLGHVADGIMASPYTIDTLHPLSLESILDEMLDDLAGHTDSRVIAARFQSARARQWAVAAARVCSARGIRRVVVTGSLLDCPLLAGLLGMQLKALGLEAYFPRSLSSADSAIALGQAVVAASLRA